WLSALVGVLLTPALALIGPRFPWHVAVLPPESAASARPAEPPRHAVPATPAARSDPPPRAEVGEQPRSPGMSGAGRAVPTDSEFTPALPPIEVPATGPTPVTPPRVTEAAPADAGEVPAPPPDGLRAFASFALLVSVLGSGYL